MKDHRLDFEFEALKVSVQLGLNVSPSQLDDRHLPSRAIEACRKAEECGQSRRQIADAASAELESALCDVGMDVSSFLRLLHECSFRSCVAGKDRVIDSDSGHGSAIARRHCWTPGGSTLARPARALR